MTIAVNRNLSNCENSPKKSANAEAMGSNPVEAPKNFFSGYFRNCLHCDSLRWSHTHFICIPAVHIISKKTMPLREILVLCIPHIQYIYQVEATGMTFWAMMACLHRSVSCMKDVISLTFSRLSFFSRSSSAVPSL